MNHVDELLERLFAREDLEQAECAALFGALVEGDLCEARVAALLVALRCKGETAAEIAGAAQALRAAAAPFPSPGGLFVDLCGTGGDGHHTVNISTAAALVAAEAGVSVVKHGNRSISSRCGSADVLESVGVAIDAEPGVSRRCLDRAGICFLFAPQYHAGMRHAMPVRKALGTRTVFNILGPLVNPARPPRQLVGVFDPDLCEVLAETLGLLGCERALVVHGDGLDELALHGPTTAALYRDGRVERLTFSPEGVGLRPAPMEALCGGGPQHNGRWLKTLLAGRGARAHREAVAFNAGALLWLADAAPDLEGGVAMSLAALDGGGAARRLERWAEVSHGA